MQVDLDIDEMTLILKLIEDELRHTSYRQVSSLLILLRSKLQEIEKQSIGVIPYDE